MYTGRCLLCTISLLLPRRKAKREEQHSQHTSSGCVLLAAHNLCCFVCCCATFVVILQPWHLLLLLLLRVVWRLPRLQLRPRLQRLHARCRFGSRLTRSSTCARAWIQSPCWRHLAKQSSRSSTSPSLLSRFQHQPTTAFPTLMLTMHGMMYTRGLCMCT